jgi:phosphate transport system substrate-binding protein
MRGRGTRRQALALLLATLLLVSCTAPVRPGTTPDAQAGQAKPARCRISGSAVCMALLRLLTERYPADRVAFSYLPAMRSKGGVAGVADGSLDLGALTRAAAASETAPQHLRATVLADDALVFAVHPSVTVTAVTSEQVRGIYAGRYTDWSQLGGPRLPIRVLDRAETEVAKITLRARVFGPIATFHITSRATTLSDEVDLLAALRTQPGAIGYCSYGFAVSQRVPVRALALDGVAPSVEAIRTGRFRVIRPMTVITSEKADPRIDAFILWARGPEAARIMEENGYAPALR